MDDERVLGALRELADERLQRDLWLSAGGGRDVSSFDECVCRLFDDSGLTVALSRGQVYADDIDADLRLLGAELQRVDSRKPPVELLDDPVLGHVRQAAGALVSRIATHP